MVDSLLGGFKYKVVAFPGVNDKVVSLDWLHIEAICYNHLELMTVDGKPIRVIRLRTNQTKTISGIIIIILNLSNFIKMRWELKSVVARVILYHPPQTLSRNKISFF